MKRDKWLSISVTVLGLIGSNGIAEGVLPFGIFPFLTSGWYYKPSPTESVVLGLLLVKVLALRLASATGILPIPYHLNDLFLRSLGKRSVSSTNSTRKDGRNVVISKEEFRIIERVLLSLRRIDTNDCFIRLVCDKSQRYISGRTEEVEFLNVFRMRSLLKIKPKGKWSIWDIYEKAIETKIKDCSKEFPLCSLSAKELEFESLLSGTF